MKKIIPFTKDISFNTKIYELTSISLENTLTIEENNVIDGEFIISGEYKMNDASINTEPFIYGIPFDITLDEYYETDTLKVDIDDFKYEIINEEILRVNIDVLVEGSIKIEEEKEEITPDVIISETLEEERIDNEMIKEQDLFQETDEEVKEVIKETDNNKATSIFDNFSNNDEKYISYYVHIVRENDTIDSICAKYKITKEDLKEYNNIDKITLENKLIIPYKNDQTI